MDSETAFRFFREITIGLKWPAILKHHSDGYYEIYIDRPITREAEKEIRRIAKARTEIRVKNEPFSRTLVIY